MNETYSRLKIVSGDDICRVTVDRPEDRNSFDSVMMAEMIKIIGELEAVGTRAVVFSGGGESYFIGGADGCEMMLLDQGSAREFSRRFQAVLNLLEESPLLTVAEINGLCFGGGFEFALACDLRVASTKARIGLPEVKVGLIPGGGGTQRLPRLVGQGRAMEMILTGRLYSGTEAARLGLVNRVAEPGELADVTQGFLKDILRHERSALSLVKRAVKSGQNTTLAEGLEVEAELFSRCFTNDHFASLMIRQLKEGRLTTSADKEELIRRASK